jgi:hypothetical protein
MTDKTHAVAILGLGIIGGRQGDLLREALGYRHSRPSWLMAALRVQELIEAMLA